MGVHSVSSGMGTQDGDADASAGDTIGARVLSTIQSGWERWANFKLWARNYTPYIVRILEVGLMIVFIVGFSYWLYLFFIVGT